MKRAHTNRRIALGSSVVSLLIGSSALVMMPGASAAPANNGLFTVVNACAGKVLDVSAFSKRDQAPVWVWDGTGRTNQQWRVVGDGAGFGLQPAHAPTKALDVPGAQNVAGLALWQYEANGTNAQRWTSQDLGGGQVRLISAVGGKALQVRNGGSVNASPVELADPAPTCAQAWTFVPVGAPPTTQPPTTQSPTTQPPTTQPPIGSASFYVAPGGSDANPGSAQQPLASVQEAVNRAGEGQKILVRAGTYNLTSALKVIGKRGITIEGESGAILNDVSKPTFLYGHGTVRVEASISVRITGLRVQNSPYFGFRVSDNSASIEIENNTTFATKASAIFVDRSSGVRIIGNDVSRFCDAGSFVTDESGAALGCQEGISVGLTNGFNVSDNIVHDSPMLGKANPQQGPGGGEGIDIKQGSQNGVVRNNRVYNLVQVGIYVDAFEFAVTNVEVSGNIVFDNASGIVISSEKGAPVTNVRVFNNISYRNGLVGIGIARIMDDGPRNDIQIYNNTVYMNGIGESKPAWAGGPASTFGYGIANGSNNSRNVTIRDNISFANTTSQIELETPAAVAATTLTGNFTSDPQFVNAAGGDFTLRPGSPAAGKGARP